MKVLSKSRFKLGLECPNKLYFTGNKSYANKKSEDTFLLALAKGGFQVEELARMHYLNGVFIDTENYEYEKAYQLTQDALLQENVVIYEAAFLVNNYFIRTDILVNTGTKLRLIEVKAKSFNPNEENIFALDYCIDIPHSRISAQNDPIYFWKSNTMTHSVRQNC